jgi:translation initiation factor IF-3
MAEDKKTESKDTVRLNGREMTRDDFQRQKEAAKNQKGVDLKEISKDDFKMRLKG